MGETWGAMEGIALPGNACQVRAGGSKANLCNNLAIPWCEDTSMKRVCFAVGLLFSASLLLAKDSKQITVQGCVAKASGDYILQKQNPAMTYELQASGKTRLSQYLGQRVEVTGTTSPSMSTSSDAIEKMGAPSSVTLTISSIRTISKECTTSSGQQP